MKKDILKRATIATAVATTTALSLGTVAISMAPLAGAQTVPHNVILYTPTISRLNTVHVEGRVEGIAHPTGEVTLLAKYADIGQHISESHVHVGPNGEFSGNLTVTSGKVTFVASYPGASSAGVTRYFNAINIVGNWPSALTKARTTAQSMGTTFPVKMPTWLPQQLGSTKIHDPFYSTTVAAKSFTYTTQIFQTEKPFPVNDQQAINTPLNHDLVDVSGTRNVSTTKAHQQLMWHASQVLPSLSSTRASKVPLGSGLYGMSYADKWHTVTWQEGKWLLVARGPYATQNISEAMHIVSILDKVYLPPTNGVVWVRNINDGSGPATPYVAVSYQLGKNIYEVNTIGTIYDALVMTASMKG